MSKKSATLPFCRTEQPVKRRLPTPCCSPEERSTCREAWTPTPRCSCTSPRKSPGRSRSRPAVGFVDWKGVRINIIDTPGYINFLEETKGTLRAVDGAIAHHFRHFRRQSRDRKDLQVRLRLRDPAHRLCQQTRQGTRRFLPRRRRHGKVFLQERRRAPAAHRS